MPHTTPPKIRVVAGIVYRQNGDFLLSSRPAGKPYAGYWEFAGGKVEHGETELAALQREFMEELGIRIHHARPWLTRVHLYEHAEVHLQFWRVAADEWSGEPQAREQQEFLWHNGNDTQYLPMLPANAPIFKALSVPTHFSGSLKNGLHAANGYCVAPCHLAEANCRAVLLDSKQLQQLGHLPDAESVWVRLNHIDELHQAADADVLVFAVAGHTQAQQVLSLLAQGVGVPLIVAADAALCRHFAAAWLQAGAHTVLIDDTLWQMQV